ITAADQDIRHDRAAHVRAAHIRVDKAQPGRAGSGPVRVAEIASLKTDIGEFYRSKIPCGKITPLDQYGFSVRRRAIVGKLLRGGDFRAVIALQRRGPAVILVALVV